MKRSNSYSGVLACILLIFMVIGAPSPGEGKDFSHTDNVVNPNNYSHIIKANPGDRFIIKVTSDLETSAYLSTMVPISQGSAEWGYNQILKSKKNTYHELEYTAPETKPTKGAAFWHYKFEIFPNTYKWTKFTVNITQIDGGIDLKKPRKSDEEIFKLLDDLTTSMGNEMKRLRSQGEKVIPRLESLKKEYDEVKKLRTQYLEEMKEINRKNETEKDSEVLQSRFERFDQVNGLFKGLAPEVDRLLAEMRPFAVELDSLTERYNEIRTIGVAIDKLLKAKDFDKALALANESDVAKAFGWKPLTR